MDHFKRFDNVDICDVCGSNRISSYYKDSDIVVCLDCNFLFVSPRPSLDDIKHSYSDSGFYDTWITESKGRLKLWNKRFNRIKNYLKGSSALLDFSAGIGTFLHTVQSHGHTIHGTELSESAKSIALRQYNIELFDPQHFFNNTFSDYFDIITAWHVVEHVESPRLLLTEFYNILRPGGYLIVAVPNANFRSLKRIFRQQNMDQVFPKLKVGDEIHVSHFTEDTLVRLLTTVGFRILEVGIDDHFAKRNCTTRTMYTVYQCIRLLTHKNISHTIYVVAQK